MRSNLSLNKILFSLAGIVTLTLFLFYIEKENLGLAGGNAFFKDKCQNAKNAVSCKITPFNINIDPSKKKNTPASKKQISLPEIAKIKKGMINITSTIGVWPNKENKTAAYEAYYTSGNYLRVVCPAPCPIPEAILKNKLIGAQKAVKNLTNFVGITVLTDQKPVDIHLMSSVECGNYTDIKQKNKVNGGYVSKFSSGKRGTISNGSYMCLWEWEDETAGLSINPVFAALLNQQAEENALRLEAQDVVVHEYGHILLLYRFTLSPPHMFYWQEDLVKTLSFYITGKWNGNGYQPEDFPLITDACSSELNEKNGGLFIYNLCTICGFKMDDIPVLLNALDYLYKNGLGNGEWGIPTKLQLKLILDEITGKDSIKDCVLSY